MADVRARDWTFEGYPGDSLPENYREILSDELHLCYAESPVHDKDVNADGTVKKPHIHFALHFEGKKSYTQIKEITDRLNCPIPQATKNTRGLIRYFIHLDNPDKWQYKREDIKAFGGFEIEEYFKRSTTESRQILKDIMEFIANNEINDFAQLSDDIFASGDNDWIDVLTSRNSVFLSQYMRSRSYREKQRREETREYFAQKH